MCVCGRQISAVCKQCVCACVRACVRACDMNKGLERMSGSVPRPAGSCFYGNIVLMIYANRPNVVRAHDTTVNSNSSKLAFAFIEGEHTYTFNIQLNSTVTSEVFNTAKQMPWML